MNVASVKRWQWVAVGLLVGLALWGARRWGAAGGLYADGRCINDQGTFERALLRKVGGRPLFKDVHVHRQRLADGKLGSREVHVVTGRYCTGRPDASDNQYHWRPAVFIASIPYQPKSGARSSLDSKALARFDTSPSPTVVEFLAAVERANGPSYAHAWWETYPALSRIGGSVLLIGVVWPTLVNLLAFGRLTRPREERATIDLSAVASPPPEKSGGLSAEDLAILARVEAELEENLGVSATPPADVKREPQPVAAPRVMAGGALDATVAVATEDEKHFAAKADDFYPTDRSAHR